MKKTLLFTTALATIIYSCNDSNENQKSQEEFIDPITAHIDSSISPGENFFLFANNGWFKKHPIPSSEKSNGIFQTIQDTINESVKKICESAAADSKSEKGSNKQKIGDLYFSGMDTATIEKAGITLLKDEFTKIDNIKNTSELVGAVAELNKINARTMFSFYVIRDDKKSSQYVVSLGQASLGLPERDYYFNTDSRTINIRNEYVKHVQKMFELIGTEKNVSEKNGASVMYIETMLAKVR